MICLFSYCFNPISSCAIGIYAGIANQSYRRFWSAVKRTVSLSFFRRSVKKEKSPHKPSVFCSTVTSLQCLGYILLVGTITYFVVKNTFYDPLTLQTVSDVEMTKKSFHYFHSSVLPPHYGMSPSVKVSRPGSLAVCHVI